MFLDPDAWGYWAYFWLMVLENVIPPVPSEVIMGLGGIAAAKGKLDIAVLIAVGTAGTVIGNLFWYAIGRWVGYERLEPWVGKWGRWLTLEWQDIRNIHRFFNRWGRWTVLVMRFMPIGRTIISLPAGMMGMPPLTFILFTAVGSLIWNTLLVGIGYWLGTTFKTVDAYVHPVLIAVVVVLVLGYVWRVVTWKPRARR